MSKEPAMTDFYAGKIKVVCVDMLCFAVDPKTLEPISASTYDPYAYSDPEPALETISHGEWCVRRNAQRMARAKP